MIMMLLIFIQALGILLTMFQVDFQFSVLWPDLLLLLISKLAVSLFGITY